MVVEYNFVEIYRFLWLLFWPIIISMIIFLVLLLFNIMPLIIIAIIFQLGRQYSLLLSLFSSLLNHAVLFRVESQRWTLVKCEILCCGRPMRSSRRRARDRLYIKRNWFQSSVSQRKSKRKRKSVFQLESRWE